LSHPPDYPGRKRVKRAAGSAAGGAYQGALEAVMAVLFGAGVGYWVDERWDTTPIGVISGLAIGFAAMVLRLLRLGSELVPSVEVKTGGEADAGVAPGSATQTESESDRGPAEALGEIGVWRDVWSDDATDERESNERE
jgi:F0F1-type ATP synthase assembly protein I